MKGAIGPRSPSFRGLSGKSCAAAIARDLPVDNCDEIAGALDPGQDLRGWLEAVARNVRK